MVDVPEEARQALAFVMAHRHDEAFDPAVLRALFGPDAAQWADSMEDLTSHGYVRPQRVVLPEAHGHGAARNWVRSTSWRRHWRV